MGHSWIILPIVFAYFFLLIVISYFTGRNSGNDAFFLGEKKSPWFVVAYGMIGASLSGVTFISIPGWVGATGFSYFQMVLGYLVGYFVIANVLMPVYYRLNLITIYTYLRGRFGVYAYRTGSITFLVSRLIGSSLRLYLMAIVFELIFRETGLNIPFYLTVTFTVFLIWVYTFRGGIKTIIWTDTFQTTFMLLAVVLTIHELAAAMNLTWTDMLAKVWSSDYSKIFNFNHLNKANHFIRYFISGMLIAIAMTGLDQDMMQKNLSCRNLHEARKNMYVFSIILVFVNLLFLVMGAMLYIYADSTGFQVPLRSDYLYPELALSGNLGLFVLIFFSIGLVAAAYSSADSALTALTTSFCIDILEIDKKLPPEDQVKVRKRVHLGMSLASIIIILVFRVVNDESVINNIMVAAGYTYGPLLGMFGFGLMTKLNTSDKAVPLIAISAPILTYVLQNLIVIKFPAFEVGFEIILLNALISFSGLMLMCRRTSKIQFNKY